MAGLLCYAGLIPFLEFKHSETPENTPVTGCLFEVRSLRMFSQLLIFSGILWPCWST